MSWQSYVDTNLVGTGSVTKAAIIGLENQVWAKSANLDLSTEEIESLATAFSKQDTVRESGLKISGQKYFTLRLDADVGSIQLKKQVNGACVFKTTKAIILGVYESPIQQAECYAVVSTLGEYLKTQNY